MTYLSSLIISAVPSNLPGTLTLSWGSNIKLWETANKDTEVTKTTYTASELPKTYYVEGYNTSNSLKDTQITLSYTAPDNTQYQDTAKITVIQIDLSATDLYGSVPELFEESIGAYVHYNIDNDNGNIDNAGNPIADKDEDGPITDENDLKQFSIILNPSSLDIGKVVLRRINTNIRVWKDATKGLPNDILRNTDEKIWNLSDLSQRAEFNNVKNNLWIEGFHSGVSNLTVEYRGPNDNVIDSDTVKYTFIGAICGRQPTPEERSAGEGVFPNLIHCEWSITGEATPGYNCIAWSVGETDVWYNPEDIDQDYGDNDGVFEISDMDAFYDAKGYIPTGTGYNDAEIMYYSGFHAARKMNCGCGAGKWIMFESKCGEWLRIEHEWNQLNGSIYGIPIRYYKRK